MASVSLARVRDITGLSATAVPDSQLGLMVGVANAIFYSLTKKDLGHAIEAIVAAGANVNLTVYGHLLGLTGKVFLSGCGAALDGERDFKYVDDNTISILGVTLAGTETLGRLHTRRVFDAQIIDQTVTVSPSPAYKVVEVLVSPDNGPPDFSDATSVDLANVGVRQFGTFKSTVEILLPLVSAFRRVRGFINPQMVTRRRMVRVTYYSGLESGVPLDILQAIASAAKEIIAGGGTAGSFNSESIDYYSYSRASLQELKDYPFSTISVFLRYA